MEHGTGPKVMVTILAAGPQKHREIMSGQQEDTSNCCFHGGGGVAGIRRVEQSLIYGCNISISKHG